MKTQIQTLINNLREIRTVMTTDVEFDNGLIYIYKTIYADSKIICVRYAQGNFGINGHDLTLPLTVDEKYLSEVNTAIERNMDEIKRFYHKVKVEKLEQMKREIENC